MAQSKDLPIRLAVVLVLAFFLALVVYPDVGSIVQVNNSAPEIVSVSTFSSYTDDSNNVPSTNFSSSQNQVYIQAKIRDPNGYGDITGSANGTVKFRIVLWDMTNETNFTRFGSEYVNGTFESASGLQVIYTYMFVMDASDPERRGTESPPLYYRVKVYASDGDANVTGNTSSEQNADYTYGIILPPTPPTPTAGFFVITVDVPPENAVVAPGDSFYATVVIAKNASEDSLNTLVVYSLIDPYGTVVDSYSENVVINDSYYSVPVLFVPEDAEYGTYTLRVSAYYVAVESRGEAQFTVSGETSTTTTSTSSTTSSTTQAPSSTTSTTRHHGGGGGRDEEDATDYSPTSSTTSTTIAPKAELSIRRAPDEVVSYPGGKKSFTVSIENTGEIDVSDVTPYLDLGELSGNVSVRILPQSIDRIGTNLWIIVLVEIDVSEDAQIGRYPVTFHARCEKAQAQKEVALVLVEKPSDRGSELRERIRNTQILIENVVSNVGDLPVPPSHRDQLEEIYVLLDSAHNSVSEANASWRDRSYDETEAQLTEAQGYVEESIYRFKKLEESMSGEPTLPPGPGPDLLYYLLMLSLFLLIGLFVLYLKKKKNPVYSDRRRDTIL